MRGNSLRDARRKYRFLDEISLRTEIVKKYGLRSHQFQIINEPLRSKIKCVSIIKLV